MSFGKFGWVSYASQTRVGKFVEYLEQGKICGTKCKECGAVQFPPRAHCARCLSNEFEWSSLSGLCTLITYTKVDSSPSAFKEQTPYILALADFPEGPKVFASIDKAISADDLAVGMRLQLRPLQLSNGNWSYVFSKPDTA